MADNNSNASNQGSHSTNKPITTIVVPKAPGPIIRRLGENSQTKKIDKR